MRARAVRSVLVQHKSIFPENRISPLDERLVDIAPVDGTRFAQVYASGMNTPGVTWHLFASSPTRDLRQ